MTSTLLQKVVLCLASQSKMQSNLMWRIGRAAMIFLICPVGSPLILGKGGGVSCYRLQVFPVWGGRAWEQG